MTSPFRDPPVVELGPLDVGLEEAAARALLQLPRGGRLVAHPREESDPHDFFARALAPRPNKRHALGALGSGGFVLVLVIGLIAARLGWFPTSLADLAASAALVLLGGASLATVLRVTDRAAPAPTCSGGEVGRSARRLLLRVARLAMLARRSPQSFDRPRRLALTRAIAALETSRLRRWIPDDVRGRMELLLARATARDAGRALTLDPRVHREVQKLLLDASSHLVEPATAQADLDAIAASAPIELEARQARS